MCVCVCMRVCVCVCVQGLERGGEEQTDWSCTLCELNGVIQVMVFGTRVDTADAPLVPCSSPFVCTSLYIGFCAMNSERSRLNTSEERVGQYSKNGSFF